jgi:hypothetical protein
MTWNNHRLQSNRGVGQGYLRFRFLCLETQLNQGH